MTLKFGTDGVRGRAHDELTVDLVERLSYAAAAELGASTMVIADDGRESGPEFVAAVAAGCRAAGVDAFTLGTAPTPAVAHVAATDGIAGAMVSASHNPFHDNGIKFFAPGGRKLTDEIQHAIEARLADGAPVAAHGATVPERPELVDAWARSLESTIAGRSLAGLTIVVDGANGAASHVGPWVLRDLGADVVAIHDRPTGRNINDRSGSTHPAALQEAVVERGADAGIAFDGDADRLVAVDHTGAIVDGDHIIAIAAIDMDERGQLRDDTVVVTVMTNLGFRLRMDELGIHVHETPVGDRYVLEALEAHGWTLGGEQSGHVIFPELATTGDGVLTALQLLDAVCRSGESLQHLSKHAMTRLPQVLRNVEVSGTAADLLPHLAPDIAEVEDELGRHGRVLVRPSGTEPLLRIMVEAPEQGLADAIAGRLVAATERLLQA